MNLLVLRSSFHRSMPWRQKRRLNKKHLEILTVYNMNLLILNPFMKSLNIFWPRKSFNQIQYVYVQND